MRSSGSSTELHIIQIPINRFIIYRAVADLERASGTSFTRLKEAFRMTSGETVPPEATVNAARNLTELLRRLGLPVHDPEPGRDIVLLDIGMRGTVRAALKEMYWPNATVQGFYLFRAAVYDDPHPEADRGYVFDLDAEAGGGGWNLNTLPDDPGLTFRANKALLLLEELTCGPRLSPDRIDDNGRPVQRLFRDEPVSSDAHHLAFRLARDLDSPLHEGVLRIIRAAIRDYAEYAARCERRGADVQTLTRSGRERMVQSTRAWVAGNVDAMHQGLRKFAEAYCRPDDSQDHRPAGGSDTNVSGPGRS